jgi:hypothetical protein
MIRKYRQNNIIIIDWDDTLYPTTWTTKNKLNFNDEIIKENYILFLKDLDNSISNLLINLNRRCDIYIISNGSISWINSCLKLLPKSEYTIKNGNIRIISSRDIYQSKYQPKDWKILTFNNLIKSITQQIESTEILNIISLGDAEYEYNALINIDNLKLKNKFFLKSIKFISKPDYIYIIEQIDFINNNYNNIINKFGFIDLVIETK